MSYGIYELEIFPRMDQSIHQCWCLKCKLTFPRSSNCSVSVSSHLYLSCKALFNLAEATVSFVFLLSHNKKLCCAALNVSSGIADMSERPQCMSPLKENEVHKLGAKALTVQPTHPPLTTPCFSWCIIKPNGEERRVWWNTLQPGLLTLRLCLLLCQGSCDDHIWCLVIALGDQCLLCLHIDSPPDSLPLQAREAIRAKGSSRSSLEKRLPFHKGCLWGFHWRHSPPSAKKCTPWPRWGPLAFSAVNRNSSLSLF